MNMFITSLTVLPYFDQWNQTYFELSVGCASEVGVRVVVDHDGAIVDDETFGDALLRIKN